MPPDKITGKKVSKDQFRGYWKKAREFETAMNDNLAVRNWNAATMSAVHAVILANDALLIYFHGVKSTSEKHDDAIRLLTTLFKSEEAKRNSRHLSRLINAKSTVEYTGKLIKETSARESCKKARRFLSWVNSLLPGA